MIILEMFIIQIRILTIIFLIQLCNLQLMVKGNIHLFILIYHVPLTTFTYLIILKLFIKH
jgi:hypothetical protein